MIRGRVGSFQVTIDLIEESPDCVAEFFSRLKFIPFSAECLYGSRCFEYVGLSVYFDEVDVAGIVPKYELSVKEKEGGGFDIEAERMNE